MPAEAPPDAHTETGDHLQGRRGGREKKVGFIEDLSQLHLRETWDLEGR